MCSITSNMTTNMEKRVLIVFFFVYTAAGVPVKEATKDDISTLEDYSMLKNSMAQVYDDNENLVTLTLDDDDDDKESLDETAKDLENRVFFFLFTKDNPIDSKPLYVDDEDALANSHFDFTKPTRFITHGWMNSRNSPACTLIRDAYLIHDDYNVVVIDWSKISVGGYIGARRRVGLVGGFIAKMINFLTNHGMDLTETALVGHSLGAHVVGLAARNTKGEVNMVVGLDPALPGFSVADRNSRISSGDAKFVEIIHTNGGLLGFLSAIGDADFYPNGGQKQLGCLVDVGGACSHARSFKFFAESINSDEGFHGRSCTSFTRFRRGLCDDSDTSLMGGHKWLFSARGNYYLMTKSKAPFANGPFRRFSKHSVVLNSTN